MRYAYVQALPVPFTNLGTWWEGQFVEELDRIHEEFCSLGDDTDVGAPARDTWLNSLAASGLRCDAGKMLLLGVQKHRGVTAEEMDDLSVEDLDALVRPLAQIMLSRAPEPAKPDE